jgi:AbrB family looped-hinge helix DNA binding protein
VKRGADMHKVTISRKGQISLPAVIRKRFGLKEGDKLGVEEKGDALLLRPLPEHPLLNMRGKFKKEGQEKLTTLLLEDRQRERERERW